MAQVILRLTLDTNAVGPFNIYTGSTATSPILSNKTRDQLVAGIPYDFPAEPDGTTYTLIFENLQPGCEDQTITKRFTLTGNLDVIDLTATYEPGSVVATYFARSRNVLDKALEFSFVNILGVTSGSTISFNPTITIPQGGTTGSTVVSDSGADFNLLDYSSIFSGITFTTTGASEYVFSANFKEIFPTPTPTPSFAPSATPTVTPTVTPSSTFTGVTPTPTSSVTPTITPTQTITGVTTTPTATPSSTPAVTPDITATPFATATPSPTVTPSPTGTPGATPTSTPTSTPQSTVTPTASLTPQVTQTNTPTVTVSSTPTGTPVATSTNTPTVTASNTPTPTQTPGSTVTPTPTSTPEATTTPTVTASNTPTPTPSNTADVSQTPTPTNTATPSVTPSISVTPSVTPSITATVSPTVTPSSTPQATVTVTPSNTPTSTPVATSTPTVTPSVTPSETPAVTPTSTSTPTQTAEVTPTATATSTPTQTPTLTQTVTPSTTPAPTPDFTATPFETPTNTPTPSTTVELSPTPTVTSTPSGTPQATVTPTVTSTPDVTPTSTVTQTPGPTKTPSSTPEPTQTSTPTPSPAATVEFYLNATQGAGFPDSSQECQTVDALVYTNDFGPVGNAQIGDFVFLDPGLTTPFAGANLWYDAENTAGFVGTVKFQIEDSGRIRDIADCPTPVTPTPTETSAVTPTPTSTPDVTPTSTPSGTPAATKTPTPTPEPTQTSTPTPSPAATVEFYLNAAAGAGSPDSNLDCEPVDALVYTNDFGPVGSAQIGDFVFVDPGLTTPFAGQNLWYDAENTAGFVGTVKFQIEDSGRIRDIAACPTPVTPTPTPTQTAAVTPTPSVTPSLSVTPTHTPTPSVTPSTSLTPTPSVTPSVTPSSAALPPAYLLIEPNSIAGEIGGWMFNEGAQFYGFTNSLQPQDANDVRKYMEYYSQFEGQGNVPSIIPIEIPQVGGGVDSEGNEIVQYNFTTTQIPSGLVPEQAWYTFIIPDDSIGGTSSGNRQFSIDVSYGQGPNTFETQIMNSTYYNFQPVVNPGGAFITGSYRMYTTFTSEPFFLDNTGITIYFKGNTVS